jgi:hypothetical protein
MVSGQYEGVRDNGGGGCREGLWSRLDMEVVRFALVVVVEVILRACWSMWCSRSRYKIVVRQGRECIFQWA